MDWLRNFDTLTPEVLGVDAGVIGRRQNTPTREFYKNEVVSGQLPPASSTFPRSPHAKVFEISNKSGLTKRSANWEYLCYPTSFDDGAPWYANATDSEREGGYILLLHPGEYTLTRLYLEFRKSVTSLEIVGMGATPEEVILYGIPMEDEDPDIDFPVHVRNGKVRFCNATLMGTGERALVSAKCVELDSCVVSDDDPDDCIEKIHDSEVCLLRDSKFECNAVVAYYPEHLIVIHCHFRNCGINNTGSYTEFEQHPIFWTSKSCNVAIYNTLVDETNGGHVLHREEKIEEKVLPLGRTILMNNQILHEICDCCGRNLGFFSLGRTKGNR
jgi:hypothetical protein